MLECELPGNGSRFTARVPTTVVSAPMVTIGECSLVQRTMRLRPDRIVVGEVRGAEALELLKAWGPGHPGGAATIHAETAHGALVRLEQLVAEEVPHPSPQLIPDAMHIVMSIQRNGQHPLSARSRRLCM